MAAQAQVLFSGQTKEGASPIGNMTHAKRGDLLGGAAVDPLATECDFA